MELYVVNNLSPPHFYFFLRNTLLIHYRIIYIINNINTIVCLLTENYYVRSIFL